MVAQSATPVPGVFTDRFALTRDGWKFAERRGSFWMPAVPAAADAAG
jgi:hypothetical protein